MRRIRSLLAGLLAFFASAALAGSSNYGTSYFANYVSGTVTWAPNSISLATMGGLAGSITPTRTGSVRICAFGYFTNTALTTGEGIANFQLAYGTGTAPAVNAALAGTQVGAPLLSKLPLAALVALNIALPLNNCTTVTGLTVKTTYWIDICGLALVNTTNTWHGAISAEEI